ncbi:uncharacterized protein LOC127075957 [Lathyrus oleraceus]|uniref:Uncharacterized protein n=1 Tax=Pisum sativum TaxID=3888 RepID=A0A9D4XI70_PEA|nr:uncharacterized protein LOC127075957 [Pisum sativum]XP_050873451.1 uncharacterized protein LOC127075957 [Pisum sativum]XP_050873452.1 uncharacterized protein LOC127075957 [Pisum sativum]XP_050873453.1 uncharacterized protein LOC127075957 [Pisum sativum]KAI5421783.1 hypothetical protein KIW84_045281 [Pisum sativum]
MTKKSQRRALRYEKDKSGCMWGFISMFDFRHGHSTRKLIADKRRSSKHSDGVVHSKNKFEVLNDIDEVCQGDFDNGESKRPTVRTIVNKPSVKKLIEEEMFIDQNAGKDINNSERCKILLKLDSKRKKKSDEKKRDMTDDLNLDATSKSETSHRQHSRKQSKDSLDLDTIVEEFCNLKGICSMMHGNDGEVEKHAQTNQKQKHAVSEKSSRDAIREFVNQMILNGKDPVEARKFLFSDELMEALQLISSDKELFRAFLQNPNPLVLKCVQEFENSQRANENNSEQDQGDKEQTSEIVNHKKHNFFRKKAKSQSKNSTNENGNTNFSNRIVILKPGSVGLENSETSSLESHDNAKYNGPSMRSSSHFSLTEIKKKLKQAIGKERHGKNFGKDNAGMRSPNKDHFFIEKIVRPLTGVTKGDKAGTNKDSEAVVDREKGIYSKHGVSSLYIEAKKHLSEMIGSEDENMDLSSRQISKTLGRIISFPDYNFSPFGSPGRNWEDRFVTAKTRLRDESFNSKSQEIKSDSNFSDGLVHVDKEENYSPARDEIVTEGDVESAKEITILESSLELVGLGTGNEDQSRDILEISDSTKCSKYLEQNVTEEKQSSSPSDSSITTKTKEQEIISDVSGRPSPVSVLDAPFLEDDASSGNSKCEPAEVSIRPLHVQFEEQDSSLVNQIKREKYCIEENELICDYIEAVLRASELTRDQLLMKCLSSDKMLDPSLFDQVELSPNRLCRDPKLLYDCINEILMEVCHDYFGASPFVSFVSPIIKPTPNMKTVISMVSEGVCWYLRSVPPPHTLDKIVRKDMEKRGGWMDLRFGAETVGSEIGDAILADLMEDTILGCVSNNDDKNSTDV